MRSLTIGSSQGIHEAACLFVCSFLDHHDHGEDDLSDHDQDDLEK